MRRPRRWDCRTSCSPSSEIRRSSSGSRFSGGAPGRPRHSISYLRRTGRATTFTSRARGRWTISAKTASGSRASSARRCASTAARRSASVWQKRPRRRAPEGPSAPRTKTRKRPLASAAVGSGGQDRHRAERVRARGRVRALEHSEIALLEDELLFARGLQVEQARQEVLLALPPRGVPRSSVAGAQVGEQRRGGRVLAVEDDPRVGVERLEQRHRSSFEALAKPLDEPFERRVLGGPGDATAELDPTEDLADDVGAERRPRARLPHVDLEQTVEPRLVGQPFEVGGDPAVSVGRSAELLGVQLGELALRGGERRDRFRQSVGRVRTGHLQVEGWEEQLLRDQVVDEALRAIGIEASRDERVGDLRGEGAVFRGLERRPERRRVAHRDEHVPALVRAGPAADVPPPLARAVQRRIRLERGRLAPLRRGRQPLEDLDQESGVEPRVAPVGAHPFQRQARLVAYGSARDAREESERRRSRGHAREEAHERALALGPTPGLRVARPPVDQRFERGRRDEDRLSYLRPRDDLPETAPQELAVARERGGIAGRRPGLCAFGPVEQLPERE